LKHNRKSELEAGARSSIDQHTAAVLIEIGIGEDRVAELKQQR
jgi:hypothetical protein